MDTCYLSSLISRPLLVLVLSPISSAMVSFTLSVSIAAGPNNHATLCFVVCILLHYALWHLETDISLCTGFAFGLSQQNTIMGAQSAADKKYIAIATGLTNFFMIFACSVVSTCIKDPWSTMSLLTQRIIRVSPSIRPCLSNSCVTNSPRWIQTSW